MSKRKKLSFDQVGYQFAPRLFTVMECAALLDVSYDEAGRRMLRDREGVYDMNLDKPRRKRKLLRASEAWLSRQFERLALKRSA